MANAPAPQRLVLTRQPRLPFERIGLALALVVLVVAPLIFLFTPLWLEPAVATSIRNRLLHDPRFYALPLIVAAALYWQWRQRHHETLRLDAQGIAYTPPFTWWPQKAFQLKWSELEQIELQPPVRRYPLIATRLRLIGKGRSLEIKPLEWLPPVISWSAQRARQKLRALRRGDCTEAFTGSAIGQYLAAQGIAVTPANDQPRGFDLLSHRLCAIAVAGIILLLLYALLDGVTLEQRALEFSLWPIQVGAGVLMFPVMLMLLLGTTVPRTESIGVAALFSVALGAAAYPASLRVNQLSDGDGAETVMYSHQGNGHFVASGFPAIQYEPFDPFWDTLPRNAPYALRLYHGSLGFWQLDEEPINDAMRAYYRRQRGETE